MKRAHEKFSSISKLGFSVLVACLIAVPALMGTVFVNAFNGNLVAFAADLEASPQSLSEAKAALDAAKQNQEAASAQHDEAKNAYDSSTADYNAAVSEHAVAQKASDEAKAKGKSEFNAAKANAAAKVDAAQKKLDQANTEKQDLLNELKAQEQVVAAAQAAYDAAAANAPGVEEASANLKRGQEDKAASEAELAKAQKAADDAEAVLMAAKEDEKEAAKRFNEAVNAHNESVRVHNQAARAYDKAWEALHNAEGDPTGELQAALNDAWNKYQQAKQSISRPIFQETHKTDNHKKPVQRRTFRHAFVFPSVRETGETRVFDELLTNVRILDPAGPCNRGFVCVRFVAASSLPALRTIGDRL